ncbi:hypothetical protein ACHAW6_001371, partial [Cyclotella cf. meneghiniana]
PQGNVTEKQPADDFSNIPKEFSLIDFSNCEVGDDSEPLNITTEVPVTPTQQMPATQSEGVTVPTTAGISSCERFRKHLKAMPASMSQRELFGDKGMYYLAFEAVFDYAQSHDDHLALQERMCHPVAFHADMMDNITQFLQALKQPNAPQFIQAVICETTDTSKITIGGLSITRMFRKIT